MANKETSTSVTIILGASGDIGSCIAESLVNSGRRVVLASRPSDRLKDLGTRLDQPYREVDATSLKDVEHCFTAAQEEFGGVEAAVNCVGSLLLKPAHITTDAEWADTIALNLTSAFATVRASARVMSKNGGSVLLFSSAAARIGLANHEAIAAAKAGIIGLTKSAAATYAARGIRVNAVAPGLVKTKLTSKIWENERSAEASRSLHAAGRLGEPQDIAAASLWLLNPRNDWVTGEVISVDGGLSGVRTKAR